ncbi:hypothetical protein DYB32_002206 [Aphanomyces invadans]|uniref:WW domain-containing protein n=1 Tax=Aphanomyces invadans TaxID=157072 RepID=A0A3R6WRJ0_9STRA|nr:hypothetical protein DYB32_002206 [Aphanomyces invadans]
MGILSLSNGCHDLLHVDLSRTDFQYKLTDMALLPLSERCKLLQHVNVAGCDYLTDAGLSWLAAGCSALAHLNVAHCVKLTDFSLRAIADGCIWLEFLDISGCPRISDVGLRYISTACRELHTLRLRSTILISDGMSLGRDNAQGLAALSHGCQRLQHLDLTKCLPLKPLRAAWKYGDLHEHHKARGIVPKHRAADMMFLDDYGTCWKAAIKIQVARRDAARRREEALIHWASSKMQSVFRGRQARKYAAVQRMLRRQQHDAATRIQAAYRAHVARTLTERLRKQREKERYVAMVIRVQSAWRRKQARDIFNSKRMLKLAIEARREASATVIQRAFRAYGWRKRNLLYSTALKVKKAEEEAAANKLQLLYKSRAARLEAQRKREALRLLQRKKDQAAQCLQRVIRRRRDKRLRQRQLDEEAKLNAAAQRIQRRFRRRQDMLSYQLMKLGREFQVRTEAALRLQAAWRRKQGPTRFQPWPNTLVGAGHMAKHMLRVLKDEQYQRRHQDTGEIRQRMPQDLLDLLPKPRCNDCGNLGDDMTTTLHPARADVEAAMTECGDCGEFFCSECWHAIHAGGRRRRHRFRTLYDYYGKRIDYGDGEFPSVWPSEIAQDELDGWYLRTSPFREPVLVLGDWEKYVDDSTHREWYFSRSTKVSTYLPPPAFKATAQDIALAWVRKQDGPNQIPYYFNEKTGQRTFDRPPTFVEKEDADAALEVKGVEQVAAGVERAQPTPTDASSYGVDMGNGWMQYWDDTYQVYFYYNTYTQESTYTPPDGAMDSIAL